MGFDIQLHPPFREFPEAGGLSGLLVALTLRLSAGLALRSGALNLIYRSLLMMREHAVLPVGAAPRAQMLMTPPSEFLVPFSIPFSFLGRLGTSS